MRTISGKRIFPDIDKGRHLPYVPPMRAAATSALTADQFLRIYTGSEDKLELVDGEIVMMGGCTIAHSRVSSNILGMLYGKLAGKTCRPMNSDMAVKLTYKDVRYPDVAVYCDPRDLVEMPDTAVAYQYPKVVFEVLSPSTRDYDIGGKLHDYKLVETVAHIIFIDPATQEIDLHSRTGDRTWLHTRLNETEDVALPALDITLSRDEIFAK
jgi:Uma2 family endonuclease